MQVIATEAKNPFDNICALAKSLAQREREFNETYKDWIAFANARFEQHGHWSQGLVVWRDGV